MGHHTPTLSREALQEEAGRFAKTLRPHAEHATIVTLSGELGAGKTTFAQGFAAALGVNEHVTSPTFVLAKVYTLPEDSVFSRLIHIDAYRLTGGSELSPIRFSEYSADPQNLILLEWPEMVEDALPKNRIRIRLEEGTDPDTRTITYG